MSDSEQLETGDEYEKSYWQSLFRGCKCLRGGRSLFRFISSTYFNNIHLQVLWESLLRNTLYWWPHL